MTHDSVSNAWEDKVTELSVGEKALTEAMSGALPKDTAQAFATSKISRADMRAVIHAAVTRWWRANPDLHTGTLSTADMFETEMKKAVAKAGKFSAKELNEPSVERPQLYLKGHASHAEKESAGLTWGRLCGLDLGAPTEYLRAAVATLDFAGSGKALASHIPAELQKQVFPPTGAKGETNEHERIMSALCRDMLNIGNRLSSKEHLPVMKPPVIPQNASGQRLTGLQQRAAEIEQEEARTRYQRSERQREVFHDAQSMVKAGQKWCEVDGVRPYYELYRNGHAPELSVSQRCFVAQRVIEGHGLVDRVGARAEESLRATGLVASALNAVFSLLPERNPAVAVHKEVTDLTAGPAKGS